RLSRDDLVQTKNRQIQTRLNQINYLNVYELADGEPIGQPALDLATRLIAGLDAEPLERAGRWDDDPAAPALLYKGGKWIEQPLPCGAKPRLALIHVSSEAVRTKSRTVEVGESIAEFLRLLDLPTNGPAYAEMKRQMERLAACNMMLGMSAPSRDVTV